MGLLWIERSPGDPVERVWNGAVARCSTPRPLS
jgi:hypothetical protein